MRLIQYAVFNQTTNERIYTHCNQYKCQEYLDKLPNKENFEIRHKWQSF